MEIRPLNTKPERLALSVDLRMALLAQGQETPTNLPMIGLFNQLLPVVLELGGADSDGCHAWFAALETQSTQVAFAATQPVPAKLAFAVHGLDGFQQIKYLIYNRFLHVFPSCC